VTRAHQQLEHLDTPPIEEVVCGVLFPALPGLDTVAAGAYWHERTADFPKKEIQPPIVAPQRGNVIRLGRSTVQRAWLVSASEDFLIQIQEDRFYLNWRRREAEYPRFGDHDGKRGVLSQMLEELERFNDFCIRTLLARPAPAQAHLAKIDHLVEGQHWKDLPDLVATIPMLGTLAQFAETPMPALALRFEETRKDGAELSIQMDTALRALPGQREATRIFKIEKNAARPVGSDADLRDVFVSMNAELNDVFGRLLPRPVRQRLFSTPRPGR
jgi:hypothetical protein